MANSFALGGFGGSVPSYGGSLNMQGLAAQLGQGSFPLAGTNSNYADRFRNAMQQAAAAVEPITKEMPADQKFIGPMLSFNMANQMLSSDPEIMMQTLERMEPFFQRRAEKQQQLAKESILFGSVVDAFTNKLPEAIGGAFRARNKYLPEQISIAAAGAQRSLPSYGPSNYYGFVR